LLRYFRADLVAALSNAGPNGGMQPGRTRAEFLLHPVQSERCDTVDRPAPTGVHGGHRAMLVVHQQDGDAVGGLDGDQVSGRIFKQGIAIAQYSRPATRRHTDIGMDLMHGGRTGGRSVAGAKPMVQPCEPFQRAGVIDIPGIFVKH
jgi:hypothetical protein